MALLGKSGVEGNVVTTQGGFTQLKAQHKQIMLANHTDSNGLTGVHTQ